MADTNSTEYWKNLAEQYKSQLDSLTNGNTTTTSSTTDSGSSNNELGGESVFFAYNSTQSVCEQLNSIAKDLKSRFEEIRNIINRRDEIWKGEAADRFWTDFTAVDKDYSIDEMESISSQLMPRAIEAVLDLIDQNKAVDAEIISATFTDASANDNVQSNSTTTDAYGVDTDLNNSVHANDNIQSNSTTTDAYGVDTQIINDTHVNDNIQSSEFNTTASGVNTDTINNVSVTGAFNGNASTETTVNTDSTAYNKVISTDSNNKE